MCFSVSRAAARIADDDIYTTHEGENLRDAYLARVRKILIEGHTSVDPVSDAKFTYLVKSHKLYQYIDGECIPVPESEKELNNLIALEAKHRWKRVQIARNNRVNLSCIDPTSWKRAVISGQSISGMIAAVILARAGYEVHTYEIREKYTRNIQWAVRASLLNALASIDEKLADLFKKIARPLHKGSVHIKNGTVRIKQHVHVTGVDPDVVPPYGSAMIKMDSVFTVEARVFEEELKKYLSDNFGKQVHSHAGKIEVERRGEEFEVKNDNIGIPDLIVIAEGGNSSTRNGLVQLKPMRESRWQIAGAIAMDGEGVMSKHWREEEGQRLLTGAIGHAGGKKIWIVADVHPSFAGCTDQKRIDNEFRRLAALVLQKPITEIARRTIYGPADEVKITPFLLQQTIVDTAAVGNNLIFMGDAVGAGHWSAGGGLQIAVVCHGQRLHALALNLYKESLKAKALKEYSIRVWLDTRAWLDEGRGFYPQQEEVFAPLTREEYVMHRRRDRLNSGLYLSPPTLQYKSSEPTSLLQNVLSYFLHKFT